MEGVRRVKTIQRADCRDAIRVSHTIAVLADRRAVRDAPEIYLFIRFIYLFFHFFPFLVVLRDLSACSDFLKY